MSLFKRKDSPYWWVKLTVKGHRPVQESTGTADKRQAQEFHDRRKAELWEQHRLGVKPRRTWDEAVLRYLNEAPERRRATMVSRLRWMQPYLEGAGLIDITRDVVEHLIQAGLREGTSNGTVNRRTQLLRAILRKAMLDWEWLDRVPRFRILPEPLGRVRFLLPEEATRLSPELPEHLRAMMWFSIAMGPRQGNVKRLRWAQVDMKRRRAWINADEAKGRRAIGLPLNDLAMRVLSERQGIHPEYVFTYEGKPITQISTKAWRKALKRAGIKDFRWHDLRHTWASWHAQNGTPMNVLQELGGWRSAQMVQRYAHFGIEHLERYADSYAQKAGLMGLSGGHDLATLDGSTAREGHVRH